MSDCKILRLIGIDIQTCHHQVGANGVTAITLGHYSPEPYCTRVFYQVMQDDHLHATVNDSAVAQVIYAKEKPNE